MLGFRKNSKPFERLRSDGPHGALVLAALGLACGVLAGLVTVAFRATIEGAQVLIVPGGFEALAPEMRLALPLTGGVIVIGLYAWLARGGIRTGVVHVLEALSHNEGRLPFKNAVLQFVGGAVVLIFGMALGREGPSVHLGAASGSQIGQWFRISPERLRIMVGCGVAAAIAASFNTPLAGVAFSIEVVMIEMSAASLTPIILAAVSGATVGRLFYGSETALHVPPIALATLWEMAWILAMGVAIGALAALFIALLRWLIHATHARPWWLRFAGAAVLIAGCAAVAPAIMGAGYDTVDLILVGHYALEALVVIAALKLVATAIGIAAGLPGGLIGPTLVMGAAAGGVLGYIGNARAPVEASTTALYAMLGMAAMLSATLQAPLAALLALLELTGNPHLILPGMLATVSASLAAKELFRCESVFTMQMRVWGIAGARDSTGKDPRAPR